MPGVLMYSAQAKPRRIQLSDVEIAQRSMLPLTRHHSIDLIAPGDSVLIVASDATRATGSAQVINLLVRRLIQTAFRLETLRVIFATGIHRAVRPEERRKF